MVPGDQDPEIAPLSPSEIRQRAKNAPLGPIGPFQTDGKDFAPYPSMECAFYRVNTACNRGNVAASWYDQFFASVTVRRDGSSATAFNVFAH